MGKRPALNNEQLSLAAERASNMRADLMDMTDAIRRDIGWSDDVTKPLTYAREFAALAKAAADMSDIDPVERNTRPVGTIRFTPEPQTTVEIMLALYRNPRTREVALELADANRIAAAVASCLPTGVDLNAVLESEERT